jgi:hypothetical protein
MKIGILTFHCAHNYGAVLQAYALQEFLLSEGHKVYMIDYRPDYLTEQYRVFSLKRSGPPGRHLWRILVGECLRFCRQYKRHKIFNQFIHSKLRTL